MDVEGMSSTSPSPDFSYAACHWWGVATSWYSMSSIVDRRHLPFFFDVFGRGYVRNEMSL